MVAAWEWQERRRRWCAQGMAVPVHHLTTGATSRRWRLPPWRGAQVAVPPDRPSVIAHRGACGYRPEHTLAAYDLALALGADALEVDVVPTKDGVLVCRHERDLAVSTDVADRPELASRRRRRGGVSSWFVDDLTLAEVRQLRARETRPRLRVDNTRYDDWFSVPTLAEVLDLVEVHSQTRAELVGLYVETKQPRAFARRGLPLEPLVTAELAQRHLDRPNGPVVVQSFDAAHLRTLSSTTALPLVQLVDAVPASAAMLTPAGLREISTYAGGVGLRKDLVLPRDATGGLASGSVGAELVSSAHSAALGVSVWTLRDENAYLPVDLRTGPAPAAKGEAHVEVLLAMQAGVDAVITDHVDTALEALAAASVAG
ncbi:MAG: Glycerophosphoryl diester phosphodiesterase [uncultured Nocardioidaceae bacterium]|uniref:glycerophosphodiester phosphodiesterase n=1 Tax=uncultured Nocardioidaceae bacterium TaxID=253824 RepID=A0A6J4L931_9ACTN|nr:MAG: Glycerophosphoryl diester phosphodiesterase [uncultured Nocardioidaceae bacterium]